MMINGQIIPKIFLKALKENKFYREVGSWPIKNNVDSFGNILELDLGYVFSSENEINDKTNNLAKDFEINDIYGKESEWSKQPGFIKDITNFSKIVAFGISGDGAIFCFDFRHSKIEPAIIWWDDCYWRKISPNIKEFLSLFEFNY
jgi:hypothetical protein